MGEHLKDLQSLLQRSLGDNYTVDNYTTEDLLPPGENYGSKMLKVDVKLKNQDDGKTEELHLVGKLLPSNPQVRAMLDFSVTFKKETFMYSKLLPYYRKLEIENGVDEAFNFAPKCYGSRLGLGSAGNFDDNALLLLENLKPQGYYCVDRRTGCSLPHARIAVNALANFHALGMATKENDPEFFETLKIEAKSLDIGDPEKWKELARQRFKDIDDDPEVKKYYKSCETMSMAVFEKWMAPPEEPWASITHSDFWTNNFMFRDGSDGQPDDIKLVDFQNFLFTSPLREIIFFVTSGLDSETVGHVDELIDFYYETLIEKMKSLGCDVSAYSRESFDEKMREDAAIEFGHSMCLLHVITLDSSSVSQADNIIEVMESKHKNVMYQKRLRELIRTYCRKGWLKE
ncbi:EcKinase 6 [Fopius arisanus]|uniref:LigA_1 protein n=1 Tax=Fopius arisanus TaxID=64838 RepID=A0A0C9RLI1_9HYME|nr:EcKinase 6 [Fopius arisanus]